MLLLHYPGTGESTCFVGFWEVSGFARTLEDAVLRSRCGVLSRGYKLLTRTGSRSGAASAR